MPIKSKFISSFENRVDIGQMASNDLHNFNFSKRLLIGTRGPGGPEART